MKEKHVRDWVRRVWAGRPITWVETRRGSTVGAADLYLPIAPMLLPVELKVFAESSEGYVLDDAVRPAQVVYHHHLHKVGVETCFMFGLKGENKRILFVDGKVVVRAMLREDNKRVIAKSNCVVMTDDWQLNQRWIHVALFANEHEKGNLFTS